MIELNLSNGKKIICDEYGNDLTNDPALKNIKDLNDKEFLIDGTIQEK